MVAPCTSRDSLYLLQIVVNLEQIKVFRTLVNIVFVEALSDGREERAVWNSQGRSGHISLCIAILIQGNSVPEF